MQCPQCQCLLEPWEVFCHGCARVLLLAEVPAVQNIYPDNIELKQAFDDWLNKGKQYAERKDFEQAVVCFHEALRRSSSLPDAGQSEMEVRCLLAAVLEAGNKLAEAGQQYRAIAESSSNLRQEMAGKAARLQEAAVDLFTQASNEFKAAEAFAVKLVPLYCSACKRCMAEAEVYGYRKGLAAAPRCLCGFTGAPLVKHSSARTARRQAEQAREKARLIEAAGTKIPGGRNKFIACALALSLGFFGAHRFYLGDKLAGVQSLLFCWTFIPWLLSFFDLVALMSMSDISFNLQYNIDLVLDRLPDDSTDKESAIDVFSMEITDDPQDYIDDLSGSDVSIYRQ